MLYNYWVEILMLMLHYINVCSLIYTFTFSAFIQDDTHSYTRKNQFDRIQGLAQGSNRNGGLNQRHSDL